MSKEFPVVFPTFEMTEEQGYQTWLTFEGKFESKDQSPGFFTWDSHASVRGQTPGDGQWPVRWTTYRREDGKLLGMFCTFNDLDDAHRTLYIHVHPDHQRQGIGRILTDFIYQRYETERGEKFPYDGIQSSMRKASPAIAAYLNKTVPLVYNDDLLAWKNPDVEMPPVE